MKTSAEYLALAQRYRIAKLSTRDVAARDQLEAFERSYFALSKSAQILLRFKALMKRSAPSPRHDAQQPPPFPTRPEAGRRLVEIGLKANCKDSNASRPTHDHQDRDCGD